MNYNSTHGFVIIDTKGSRNFDITLVPSYHMALCFSLASLMGNSGSDLADLRPERTLSKPKRADFEPKMTNLRFERAGLRSVGADWRPERADFEA